MNYARLILHDPETREQQVEEFQIVWRTDALQSLLALTWQWMNSSRTRQHDGIHLLHTIDYLQAYQLCVQTYTCTLFEKLSIGPVSMTIFLCHSQVSQVGFMNPLEEHDFMSWVFPCSCYRFRCTMMNKVSVMAICTQRSCFYFGAPISNYQIS